MKTFTTCAEKKAKQILNLLQGYTKGIRTTAILILLLMGVSNAWGMDLYLDISSCTGWTNDGATLKLYPGTGSDITGTKINDKLYKFTVTSATGTMWFKRMSGSTTWNQFSVSYNSSYNVYKLTDWNSGSCANYNISTVTKTNYIYFDNSTTDWTNSYKYFVIGHDAPDKYSKTYLMSTISGTKLWYVAQSSDTWQDATYYAICSPTASWSGTSWGSDNIKNANKYAKPYTNKLDLKSGKSYLIIPENSNNNAALSISEKSSYDILNNNQTVYKYTSTDNGSSYSAQSINSGTVTISAYKMTGNGTAADSNNSQTINVATTTYKSVSAAYTGEVTVTASANVGYTFVGWFENTNTTTAISTETAYTYNAPNSTKSIYARFKENTYNVTIFAGTGGTVSPSGSKTIGQVTKTTVTATPNANYEFVNWTATGGVVVANTSSASTTITATAAGTLTANFRSTATHSLTVVAGNGISQVTGSADPITLGSTYDIKATPKTGYTFSTWTANPAENATFGSATTANTTVTVNNGSVTVTATGKEQLYALTTANSYSTGNPDYANPTTTRNDIGVVTTATVTATIPSEGYVLANWTLTNCERTDDGAENATAITVRANGNGAAKVVANYTAKTLVRLYYSNTNNWSKINAYLWKDGSGSDNNTWPGTEITNNVEVIDCEKYYYYEYYKEDHPDWNRIIFNNGSNQTSDITFSNSTNNGQFYINNAWVASPGPKWTLAGTMNEWNTDLNPLICSDATSGYVELQLTANTDYEFKFVDKHNNEWYGVSSAVTQIIYTNQATAQIMNGNNNANKQTIRTAGAGVYRFTWDITNKKVTVTYPTSYTVTYSQTPTTAAEAPTTTPSVASGKYVAAGTDVTFTAQAPETGYTFKGWYDNSEGTGTALSTNQTYTCTINANTTIYAVYTENTYNVAIVANPAEAASTITSSPQSVGVEAVEISTTANFTYKFENWTATTGIAIADDTKQTTTITATQAGTVTANFVQLQPTTVYLKPGDNWNQDNARFAIHYWHDGQPTGWVDMTEIDCNRDYFVGTIPAGYTEFMFVRMNPANPENKWNADIDWNQTGNLTIPTDGKNLFTLPTSGDNKWDGATSNWSTYSTPSYEIALSPRIGGTITTNPASPIEVNTEVIVTINPSAGYTFRSGSIKIGKNEAINITDISSTHTICGPTEIKAEFVTSSEQVVYLKPTSKWKGDKPTFAVHVWNNGGDATAQDIPMTAIDCNGDYYMATIPAGFHSMVFYRKSTDGTTVWNKTADLIIPTDNNNCYTISSTGSKEPFTAAEGNWGTYTEPQYSVTINAPESGTIKVTIGGVTTTVTSEAKTISNVALNAQMEVLFEPATDYKLGKAIIQIGNNEKASAAGTYTVCGPTEITAYFVTKEDQVVYLRPTDAWLADNARFAAYAFNRYAGTDAARWIELTTKDTDYTGAFSGIIPAGFSHVQFVRMPETGDFSFDIDLAQTLNYSIPTDGINNRFILGSQITSGSDKDNYQGSWEQSNTPIWSIPGDWTGDKQWTAENATPLYGPNGNATLALQASITTEFKLYQFPYGTQERQWYGNSETLVRGNSADKEFTTGTDNCKLTTDIAGDYVFSFNIRNKKLTVQYPELPVPNAITVTSNRLYDNTELGWFAGEGTEAVPYQLYIDEAVRLIVSPLTEVAGLTAYYKMGDNEEQTSNVFDWEETMSEPTKTTIQAYYKNATGTSTETASVETPYYIQISLPFYLMTEPSGEINIDRVAAGENILVQFRSDAAATVGLYVKIGNGEEQKLTDITSTISTDYTHDVDNNIAPCVLHYIARSTEAVNDRTFEATVDVVIYKNVIIKVHDPEGWVKNAYMWRDYSDAVKTQWPGEPVLQNFGTWRVFSVKYPYYDRFIVNDGKAEGATQTIDYVLPADDTCYELLDPADNGSSDPADTGKYGLQVADCPGNLMVNNIKDTTLMEGEQIVVMPEVFVGLGYKLSDVEITHLNADNQSSVRVMQSGNNIIVSGYGIGSSNVTVSFTLGTETITKTFTVTVVKNTHITIQVKVPVNFGDGNDYQWKDGTKIGIRYWGTGINGTDLTMDYAYTDATYHYAQAQLPLDTDDEINFHFYYERHSDENAKWRQSSNVTATVSGCYTLAQGSDYYRRATRNGDYCFDDTNYAQYQVKVFLPIAGKEYSSNIVTNTTDILSFFAPGQNETGYRAGTVQLYKNGKMVAAINPTMFAESNVYTATVNETGDGLDNVSTYSGNFYIRTYGTSYKDVGFNNGKGWNSIKDLTAVEKDSVRFTKFTSREGEFYNHYWVQAMNTGTFDGKDVSACVANEYNDDLAGKLLQDKHTNEYGDIKVGTGTVINVRFGYDPRTNYFGRAIINGSEYNNYLNIHCDNAYKDKNCSTKLPYGTSGLENKMQDISNWVYQRDFYVPIDNSHPSASLYVEATSPSTEIAVTDHLLGYVINEITGEETTTPVQRTVIGSGTTNGTYLIRVVYDFKTNRIIAAWLPQGTVDVKEDRTLNADVLFVRQENNEVPQIQLAENGKIRSLESMFFAMEFHRGDKNPANRRQEQYFFTLPFDCKVGSISGVHGYMQIWGIQRYRGDLRAQKGWYAETPTFWEWMDIDDEMHAGEGYLLVFDKKNAPWNEIVVDKTDANGNIIEGQKDTISLMRLYFPSTTSGFDMQQQSEEQLTRTYENHTCTLTLHDRYLQDSNWKVIGTTSYNNAGITGYTIDTNPEYEELSDAPSFRYSYNYNWENGKFTYEYTPENGKTATYNSFFGYMVQFAGTITWQPIMSETVPEGIAARRYVTANERTSFTTRLEIANAEGEKQDQTFVALDEKATTTFDQNLDLNKVMNSHKANIYTLSEGIPFAGNTLPMEKATVPVGVVTATAGEYTFRMPDGTDGIAVTLVDNITGTHTNMLMNEYTVTLDAGTIENRFYLVVDPDRTATAVENIGEGAKGEEAKDQIKKFLIDGKLFIRTADGTFDAKGQRL